MAAEGAGAGERCPPWSMAPKPLKMDSKPRPPPVLPPPPGLVACSALARWNDVMQLGVLVLGQGRRWKGAHLNSFSQASTLLVSTSVSDIFQASKSECRLAEL
jgi:hypothetical protein